VADEAVTVHRQAPDGCKDSAFAGLSRIVRNIAGRNFAVAGKFGAESARQGFDINRVKIQNFILKKSVS
ncbi:MAG TPA: hypothetical protein PKO33_08615, partial [Pyrinomonadaceae bacterium]|nr:hypothetical protein [Pyrinomonadaceae bacterium]